MNESQRRRVVSVVVLLLLLLIALLLLLRCRRAPPELPHAAPTPAPTAAPSDEIPSAPPAEAHSTEEPDELLGPATLAAPPRVRAGASFVVAWTGPDNDGDYVTIVAAGAPDEAYGSYRETKEGAELELTAPIDAGACEVRYVAERSRTVLGRAPIEVFAAEATLDAADEVVMGGALSVTWTGPDNAGDYVTLVPRETPDGQYGNYTDTRAGSPLEVRAPTVSGEAELRYMTGQGHKVLARRAVRIVVPDVSLDAPDEAVAGARIRVAWAGPDNPSDYVTIVASGTPDGQYGNYANTSAGSPLDLLVPILTGEAEIRYQTGQGHKVLARRPLRLVAAEVALSAPEEAAAGSAVSITWTGPDHGGDYLTIVPRATPDGQYAAYTNTTSGSPLTVKAPAQPGEAEIRYMTGQGGKVLARRAIRIVP